MLITNSYILHKNKPVLLHRPRSSRILWRGTRINSSSIQGVGVGVYRACKEVWGCGTLVFWRTTRINSFSENSRTTLEIEMKLCPSQQNYLRNMSRLKPHPLYSFCACENNSLRYLATLYRPTSVFGIRNWLLSI